jgi:hypothetical protein
MDQRRDATVGGMSDTPSMFPTTSPNTEQMRVLAYKLRGNTVVADDSKTALRAAADELDRLRVVIAEAPHGWGCKFAGPEWPFPCTCWKADALG